MAFGDRQPDKDISVGQGSWNGGFSDGTTLWASDGRGGRQGTGAVIKGFNIRTKMRDTSKDITGIISRGGAYDGTSIWIVNARSPSAIEARNPNTLARDVIKDIPLVVFHLPGATRLGLLQMGLLYGICIRFQGLLRLML